MSTKVKGQGVDHGIALFLGVCDQLQESATPELYHLKAYAEYYLNI